MLFENGLGLHIGNLSRLSQAKSRSLSAENKTGEKGKGGMATEGTGAGAAVELGQGWKISPSIKIASGETVELANIVGPGAIQHIWMTPTGPWRFNILRIYWDDQEQPSVECPVGDFLRPVGMSMHKSLRWRFVSIQGAHLIAIGKCPFANGVE